MRETRLFTYRTLDQVDLAPVVTISVPSATTVPPVQTQRTWAGLVNQVIAWRVHNENVIILEELLTGAVLRIVFSSVLCTRPLFISTIDPLTTTLSLVVACYSGSAGSTLLHLHVSRSLTATTGVPHAIEKSRHFISSAIVNAIQSDITDSVIALSDGRCARLVLSETPSRRRLSLFSTFPNRHSGAPPVPTSSFRSNRMTNWPAQTTTTFVSRFFTPRATGRPVLPGLPSNSGPDSLPAYSGPIDPVIALTIPQADSRLVASLHASGTISLYILHNDAYVFEADCVLPCKLSTSLVSHFLLSGPDATLLAVVLTDEHPKADSLRVYELSISSSSGHSLALSCRQLVNREGPIPPLVAAAFFAEDVIVATRTGVVTALINEPTYVPSVSAALEASVTNVTRLVGTSFEEPIDPPSSRGLIGRTLWTAVEDVDESFGLGRSIDALPLSDRDILLRAHRFSPPVVAKALRLPSSNLANREYVRNALAQIQLADDDHDLKRVKTRAEQITKLEDMVVRDISWDSSVGLIVSRDRAIHVIRPLFEPEKIAYIHHEGLLSCDQLTPRGSIAWLLSSHAICQILAAQFFETRNCDSKSIATSFMLDIATRFSQADPEKALTDLVCEKQAETCASTNGNQTFAETVELCRSILQPGTVLLSTLLSLGEWETLGEAAEQCSNELPVSSMYATGIVWLERSSKMSISGSEADVNFSDTEEAGEDENSGPILLKRAYGFFSLAAQSCGKGARQDDLLCALGLAGYPTDQLVESRRVGLGVDVEDTWRTLKLCTGNNLEDDENSDGILLGDSAFWLLERALRLMLVKSTPKTAAVVALEAMKYAPNKQQHERMRAAAFDRFLEAGELDHALKAILSQPYAGEGLEVNQEDAEALRDSIELFIGAAAEQKKLKWLAEQNLPEPLRMLCGQTLERRARRTEVVKFGPIGHRHFYEQMSVGGRNEELDDHDEGSHEYKDVYAWHVLREDFENAAYCALEWAERLIDEGPWLLRNSMKILENDHAATDIIELFTHLLIEWTDLKREALSCVSSALRLLEPENRYIARSRYSLERLENGRELGEVRDAGWVSRRLLLAHTQRLYLVDVLIKQRSGVKRLENMDHLTAEWSPYLTESRYGVEWISSMSRKTLTFDTASLCAELCCAWREEIGDDALVALVRDIARGATRKEVNFGYSDLDRVLRFIDLKTSGTSVSSRNWFVLAVDSALMTCAGRVSCPQWLVDVAAFGEDRMATEKWDQIPMKSQGDLLGVVRALLRSNRPAESALLLLRGLDKARLSINEGKHFDVSYTAIDATMETLLQLAEDYPETKKWANKLKGGVQKHIQLVESIRDDARKSIDKADDVSGYNMEADYGTLDISLVNDNGMEDISVH